MVAGLRNVQDVHGHFWLWLRSTSVPAGHMEEGLL